MKKHERCAGKGSAPPKQSCPMKNRILVLGSTGMLGSMVKSVFESAGCFNVRGTHIEDRKDLYFLDVLEGLGKLVSIWDETGGFDYVINCIGMTKDKVDESALDSVIQAIRINSLFPYQLAEFCKRRRTRVIHISTDGVFSGASRSYSERSFPDCADVYGKTKSLGEVLDKNVINIRCSILGPSPFEKRGLFEWFRSQPEGGRVYGFTNHVWNGVTTFQFADLCVKIIANNVFDDLRKESGVFHFSPNTPLTKFKLLKDLKHVLRKRIMIIPKKGDGGKISRVMVSKFKGMQKLYKHNITMRSALAELVAFTSGKG